MTVHILDQKKIIKKIIHLSDIHIRKTRVAEYYSVFSRTYEKIKKIVNNNDTLIVVCGDITDNKLMLTPVIVNQIKDFFIGLTNIADTMIILGNHDVAISNKNAMDALTPLVKNFSTKYKLHLLKENSLYEYGNLLIGVTDIYAKKITNIPDNIMEKYEDFHKVALYHGTIRDCFSESGYKFTNSGLFTVKDFEKYYDYGLFGDIHSFQYLDKNKRFAYSSSLIEQRISEAEQKHGFLCWDLEKDTSKYIEVENDYRYVIIRQIDGELYVNNNKYIKEKIKVKYPKIRLYYKNTKLSDVLKAEELLKTNHEITEIVKMNDIDDSIDFNYELDTSSEKVVEIKDYKTLKKLIKGFIKKYNIKWLDEKKKRIFKLLKMIIKDLSLKKNDRKIITLKSLEFNNLFSYGENNILDFTKLGKNKVIGIMGNNSNGKSALIDALLYSIYDKFSRGANNDALNINEKHCSSRVVLNVNGNEYIIEREIRKVGKRSQPKLQLYKNGKLITNDRKSTTTQNIFDYICEYDDIVNNNIILQFCENFLDISDSKKRDYLYSILNLDIFNDIVKSANSKKGIIKAQEVSYKKELSGYNERKILNNIKEDKIKLINLVDKKKELLEKRDNYEKELVKYKVLLGDNINLIEMIENIETKNNLLSQNVEKIIDKEEQIEEYQEIINKYSTNINKYKNIEEKHKYFLEYKKNNIYELNKIRDKSIRNIVPIKYTYDNLLKIIDENKKKIKLNKNEIKVIIHNKNKIIKKINKNEKSIIEVNDFKKIEKKYKKYEKDKTNLDKIHEQIRKNKDELELYKNKMKNVKKHKYDKNCKYCMESEKTKEKLYFKEMILELKKNINLLNKDLFIIDDSIIEKYNNGIQQINKNNELKMIINDYSHQLELIEKDYELINNKNNNLIYKLDKNMSMLNECKQNKINKINQSTCELMIKHMNLLENREYNNYINYKNKIDENNNLIKNINNDIKCLKKENSLLKKEIDMNNKEYNRYNQILKNINLKELEDTINELTYKINNLDDLITNKNKKLTEYDYSLKKIEELKDKINYCIDMYESYNEINNIIETKNGLVTHIMNNIVLIQIESKVNSILSILSDFLIELKYDNKKIIVYKKEGVKKLKAVNLCGFERFVCNMAFRLVFNQINSKISCNFLIIDEGFSCCDTENLIKLKQLFDFIKQKYSWCLAITHLDVIKDYFDDTIIIEKKNNRSKIIY
jgi:DNA repair exonuclease SbcCD ATPase subunit